MITREQFDAYNRAVANLSDGAQREIESRIITWLQTDEGRAASVAECREYAKSVMSGVVQVYDSAAASLAAEWYDRQAAENGARLPVAITATTYSPESVDETARYQARKLASGDPRGFAKSCGELGRNDVLRSLNETILRNAARDRKRGVRFARIPTGAETCTFCLMLASRGAVYHSRKTAGEFRHFHRRCDCKVVPGFRTDPDAELVEGVRPKELRDLWRRLKEIDEDESIGSEDGEALKRRAVNLAAAESSPSTGYSADNLDLSRLFAGELKRMLRKNPLEWESYVQLSKLGYRQVILHERGDASANIDLSMSLDGEWHYWDMKTIEGGAGALRKRMGECHSKWARLYRPGAMLPDGVEIDELDSPRVVVDNRFSKMSDVAAEDQMRKSMEYLSGRDGLSYAQALLILKDGSAKLIK